MAFPRSSVDITDAGATQLKRRDAGLLALPARYTWPRLLPGWRRAGLKFASEALFKVGLPRSLLLLAGPSRSVETLLPARHRAQGFRVQAAKVSGERLVPDADLEDQ